MQVYSEVVCKFWRNCTFVWPDSEIRLTFIDKKLH